MLRRWFTMLLLALAVPAWACRYSVRDTGFVDLGRDPWRLEVTGPPGFRQLCRQAAASVLLEANVTLAAEETSDAAGPAVYRLRGEGNRTLDLALPGPLPDSVAATAALLETVVASPARIEMLNLALKSYAVIILVEGTDPAANQTALAAVEAAVGRIRQLLPGMPKPVEAPPAVLRLGVERQAAERILLWSLGIEPQPSAEPRLGIVYGRGRILGSSLEGPLITRTTLQERLALVGQDCECDLDRAWLTGPVVPGRWDRSLQETAVRTLGFDPENPMVRAEVGRIVLRGEGERQRSKAASSAGALGYSEGTVDELPTDPGHDAEQSVTSPTPARESGPSVAAPPPPARVASGSSAQAGWLVLAGTLLAGLVAGCWIWWRSQGGAR